MLILIDGISGAGKTTLAAKLSTLLHTQVIHMDDLYPGWNGLEAGSRIAEQIATGALSTYRPWDWENSCRGAEIAVDSEAPVIIEGCGSITPVTARAAAVSIWMDAPEEVALERVKKRENTANPLWWDNWHAQELKHWKVNRPQTIANLVVPAGA